MSSDNKVSGLPEVDLCYIGDLAAHWITSSDKNESAAKGRKGREEGATQMQTGSNTKRCR